MFSLNAEPTAAETEIWTSSGDIIAEAATHLRNMTEYKGCDQVIRVVREEAEQSAKEEEEIAGKWAGRALLSGASSVGPFDARPSSRWAVVLASDSTEYKRDEC